QDAAASGAGARTVLLRAGDAWAEGAGGTSGALWGAALTAAGGVLEDTAGAGADAAVAALVAGIDAVVRLGGAAPGDKTMVDAALPFREALLAQFETTSDLAGSVQRAAAVAREAAEATADIAARRGRSKVLGDKSLGTPDPGALSFSVLMDALGEHFAQAPDAQRPDEQRPDEQRPAEQ
ncbi:DAK2 domain-containing protein, partial [Kocuria sp. NPDC057446]|uniref:DAK2 domain-containing protein n=1 Tax=Kocuria sp. NPDC057446 TaxID=3346137 RepID=UPI00369D0CF9